VVPVNALGVIKSIAKIKGQVFIGGSFQVTKKLIFYI
jgi:hypothetical protein